MPSKRHYPDAVLRSTRHDYIDHHACESLFDNTGIFVHRIQNEDDNSNVSLYGVKALAEAATYCLSHAHLADDADAYRYFGAVANHSADHRIEARCKEVVRSIVPKTLDLQLPENELCSRTIAASEVDHIPDVVRGPSSDSDADEANTEDDDTGETDDNTSDTEDTDTPDSEVDQEENDSEEADQEDIEQESEADDDGSDSDNDDTEQSTEVDWEAADAPKSGDTPVKCNGRLVPLEYAPSFLDDPDRDLAYEDELRDAYREYPTQQTLDEHAE